MGKFQKRNVTNTNNWKISKIKKKVIFLRSIAAQKKIKIGKIGKFGKN